MLLESDKFTVKPHVLRGNKLEEEGEGEIYDGILLDEPQDLVGTLFRTDQMKELYK